MKMITTRVVTCFFISLFAFLISFFSTAVASPISATGNNEINLVIANKKIKAKIFAVPVANDLDESCYSKREYDLPRTSILKDIEIYVDGHAVAVPRSAFSDLNSPLTASLHLIGRAFMLELRGGDGVETYTARIYFDSNRVVRRKLYDFINNDGPMEVTRYFQRVL